ncbi:MAG: potassium/proton antiporter [Spirochaetae bacterium HGW-Spirochaetae-10]|nr:MAG: potassium/proton antiporter [Spirochaetae bacterium HGW-Spirochaetae-10]
MLEAFDLTVLTIASLIIISIVMLRASSRIGVPTLLIFLTLGMIAGSDGLGIPFDDALLAQKVGVIALAFILFSGGLESDWPTIRPVLLPGALLGTVGIVLTASLLGLFAIYVLKFPPVAGMLLGAVVSSTDAAAVFNVLRTKQIGLKGELKSLLEFESGSNDTMAVILTVGFIGLMQTPDHDIIDLIVTIFKQIILGAVVGLATGKGLQLLINALHLEYEGLYPVLLSSSILFIYAGTNMIGGNPFLAVYLAGLVLGNTTFVHKRSQIRFLDGIAWLMQIVMFLTLGLLVYPSRLADYVLPGIAFSLFLMFVARPLAVFLTLPFCRLNIREKLLTSWVGLRGAAPIILATFPFAAGIKESDQIFNIVFFTVLTSLILQGSTLPLAVKLLKLEAPLIRKASYPFEYENKEASNTRLQEFIVPYNSAATGKRIFELKMPEDSLITLIYRGESHLVPTGRTILEPGDVILVLVNHDNAKAVAAALTMPPA